MNRKRETSCLLLAAVLTLSSAAFPAEYSGGDIEGIEAIVGKIDQASQPWRQQADQRIDRLRKANLEIRVVDAGGNPLSGVRVHVQQRRHAFRFGGVVRGPMMHESTYGQTSRGITPEQYKQMFLDLGFTAAVSAAT